MIRFTVLVIGIGVVGASVGLAVGLYAGWTTTVKVANMFNELLTTVKNR